MVNQGIYLNMLIIAADIKSNCNVKEAETKIADNVL